ncbi:uncharacterized protein LOC111374140 isoform X2 [Olea europaea var. sylvestris]|uniref:uncharacterized protein LOC111374140 isoform X2 n=1 Tax=Olea europaea var. sylvestris TaxID=158386 RepID=UPI000C1D6E8D|nr:uncharacterized protein LOC111374140 isoform X2 [Olea europaea var. sylvestris]
MEAVKRLTALKKAYAEIMLNTTKEAAARIMASESKAARYQHELRVAKEEGVRMLMRLKQMMDSKVRDAEATSLNQQKKIEEVEAQLQEAEDIVKDLREELREVQAELERVKNKNMLLVDEPDYTCLRELPDENRIDSSQSVKFAEPNLQNESTVASNVRIPHPCKRDGVQKCYKKTVSINNSCNGSPDLPSIILRNKEHGLFRKVCTHRIRACERNLLDGESYRSGKHGKVKNTSVREHEEGKDTFVEPAHGIKTLSYLEMNLLAGVKLSSSKSFVAKRKRAIRGRKSITPPHGEQSDTLLKPIQVLDANSGENPSKMVPRCFPHKPQPGIEPGCKESSEKEAVLVECCDAQDRMCQDQALIENLLLLRQKTEPAQSSGTPYCKLDAENLLVNDLESKSSDITSRFPDQARRERVIKYTFQRKRKRQTLSESDVNVSLETDTLERQSGNKQNGDEGLDLQKRSLEIESFEDDLPLAQVARQLMSLSENKWWL